MLVPDLVTMLTWAPEERPASALASPVVTRNSSIESCVSRSTPCEGVAIHLVVVVHAVERDVALVGTAAVDCALRLSVIVGWQIEHARLQVKARSGTLRVSLGSA